MTHTTNPIIHTPPSPFRDPLPYLESLSSLWEEASGHWRETIEAGNTEAGAHNTEDGEENNEESSDRRGSDMDTDDLDQNGWKSPDCLATWEKQWARLSNHRIGRYKGE